MALAPGRPGAKNGVSSTTRRSVSGSTASTFVIALPTAAARSASPHAATMRAPSTRPSSSSLVKMSGASSKPRSRR
jgi:hypothetical protein